MNIFILPRAIERMEEIYDYFLQFNELAAVRIYNGILDDIEKLERFPRMGAIEQGLTDCGKTFRSLVVMKNYKAIYYIEDNENAIYIATVWDCRQNPDRLKMEVAFRR